jgi:ribosome biogenesis GTPase / thiamine phosphate phosphatase
MRCALRNMECLIMVELDFLRLQRVGLSQVMRSSLLVLGEAVTSHAALMRVCAIHRETVTVHDGAFTHVARALPRLFRELAERDTALAVGDWVLLRASSPDELWVHARLAPMNHLVRRDGSGKRHPVVSNVNTTLLVMGLDDDFNPRRLERFLALAHASGVMPVVVLTKADGCADVEALREQLRGRVPPHVPVHAVDARSAEDVRALHPYCGVGETVVLLGSSGAGKSTLTNTLLGNAVQDTGAVREHDSRGKHTTTARSLHCIPNGGCIIDTPGVRTLQPDVDEATLAAGYEDIAALAGQCRFADCTHNNEPDCAVRAALPEDRLRNFHKLCREAQRETMTPLERKQQQAVWKARGKAGRERMRMKQAVNE